MHTVTVRGSISPAAGVLERGVVKTFEYSEKVQGWIDKGYVDLISEYLPRPDLEPSPIGTPVTVTEGWDGSNPDFVDYDVSDELTDTEREADEQAAASRAEKVEQEYAER